MREPLDGIAAIFSDLRWKTAQRWKMVTLKMWVLLRAPDAVGRCGWPEVEEVLVVTMAHLWRNSLVTTPVSPPLLSLTSPGRERLL